jgi:hypothetical protein
MSTTPNRARAARQRKRDSLRDTPVGAIWSALPTRDQNLLQWLLSADIVTAGLATVLVYGQLRTAQRRLARLTELGILRSFWAAGKHRPRGRHAYVLTRQARFDLERIARPAGPHPRRPDMPPSAAIHQLATHDLLAAFLGAGDPARGEGLVAWLPERACGALLGGHVRPDALAILRFGGRAVTLFVERDLGTEHGPQLADKIHRYRAAFARHPSEPVNVGFVVDTPRRARTVRAAAEIAAAQARVAVMTALDRELRAHPFEAHWTDDHGQRRTRHLEAAGLDAGWPILTPGCLLDRDAREILDPGWLDELPDLRSLRR